LKDHRIALVPAHITCLQGLFRLQNERLKVKIQQGAIPFTPEPAAAAYCLEWQCHVTDSGWNDTQKYAVVSVESVDSKTFQLACTTLPIDCVTLDMSKQALDVDGASLERAAARGVFIELQLGGAAICHHWKLFFSMVACFLRGSN
jgi:RNase P subunit p30